MSALALSVLLAVVSAVAYAAGAIVQERVAATTPGRPYAPLRHGAWWAAVALNGVGALLHVGALAYGPLSLVQPLGALTIVFALPMAAVFVGRRAGATAWRGAIMASAGLAGLLSLTGTADARSLDGGERLAVALVTFGGVAVLFLVAQRVHRAVVRSIVLATAAGAAFGIASVFTKTVAVDWTASGGLGGPAGQLPSLLTIAGLAAAGMMLSQASYRGAGLAAPLATVTVVNPVVAAAVGITLFGEHFRYGATGTALALGCGVVAAGGLILLTTERLGAHAERSATQPRLPGVPPQTPASLTASSARTVPAAPAGAAGRAAQPGQAASAGATATQPRRRAPRPARPRSRTQTVTPPALR
ncbi:DMT family transporter [Streptomyces sp. NPDC055287]